MNQKSHVLVTEVDMYVIKSTSNTNGGTPISTFSVYAAIQIVMAPVDLLGG